MSKLSPFFLNKAKKELGEDEIKKKNSLDQFKKWLKNHPFIHMHEIDDVNLLMHLRRKKFNVERAMQSFEDMKIFEKSHPEWFDIKEKEMENFLENTHPAIRMLKQRDEDGRRVVLIDIRKGLDLSLNELLRIYQTFFTSFLLDEEETQISGIVVIADCTGLKFSYFKQRFLPLTLFHFFSQMKFYPIRLKQINIVGLPAFAIIMYELIRNFFSKKLRKRLNVVKNLTELQKVVDTSDILLDDCSDYDESNFLRNDDAIRRAARLYTSYKIDYGKISQNQKHNHNNNNNISVNKSNSIRIDSLEID